MSRDLIDTLANRVGSTPRSIASRRWQATCRNALSAVAPPLRRSWARAMAGALAAAFSAPAPPKPIETMALLPDHPPVTFTWRGIRRRVKRADGPERVFGEWWKRDAELAAVRDYFRVEDEAGERFWIYRAGDGEDTATGSHRGSCMGFSDDRCAAMPNCSAPRTSQFLRGASPARSCLRMPQSSASRRWRIVDRNSLAGIVRAHEAAKATGVRLIVGCRLDLADGMSVLVYPTDRPRLRAALPAAFARQEARRQGEVRSGLVRSSSTYGEGLIAVLVPDEADEICALAASPAAGRFRRPCLSGADAAPAAERSAAAP